MIPVLAQNPVRNSQHSDGSHSLHRIHNVGFPDVFDIPDQLQRSFEAENQGFAFFRGGENFQFAGNKHI
ncbi:hypothetical protein D3C87_1945110 [compost metagenome]